jgi:glycosyltransferase 2 family protein
VRPPAWARARLLGGVLILVVVVWWVGPGPFVDGLRGLTPGTVLAAVALGALVTVCSAWRWRVVAAGLGVGLPLPAATAAYYRSQFLNSTLPGGVVGDVHRGLRHGIDAGDLGRGLRAVVWERVAGQGVQAAVALAVLLVLPSPVQAAMPAVVAVVAGATTVLLLTGRGLVRHGPVRLLAAVRSAGGEARAVLLRPAAARPVVLASLLVVGGHLGMFLLATRAAGVHGTPDKVLPLALIVLLAAAIPLNIAGWGPREGVAAWVFASAGWGAGPGTAVATAFGVMTLVATLPGAVVLLVGWPHPRWRRARAEEEPARATGEALSGAGRDGATHG